MSRRIWVDLSVAGLLGCAATLGVGNAAEAWVTSSTPPSGTVYYQLEGGGAVGPPVGLTCTGDRKFPQPSDCGYAIFGTDGTPYGTELPTELGEYVVQFYDFFDGDTQEAHISVARDTTAPTLSITRPSPRSKYVQDRTYALDFDCLDPETGAGCTASVDGGPALAKGSPLPTSVVGDHELVLTGRSGGGEVATQSVTYRVYPPVTIVRPPSVPQPRVGQLVTADVGEYDADPPPVVQKIKWQRCATGCTDIAGATGTTYVPTSVDAGKRLRLVVTAANGDVAVVATGPLSEPVLRTPSISSVSITGAGASGLVTPGRTLTAVASTPTGSPAPTVIYQWLRCDAAGANCISIGGATQASRTLNTNDLRRTIRVRATATNFAGSASVTSAPTNLVGKKPEITTLTITGAVAPGNTLVGTLVVSAVPTATIVYKWSRCTTNGACANVATTKSYTIPATQTGTFIYRFAVTAANEHGITSRTTTTAP